MFSDETAAQVAAFFAAQEGGRISVLKLVKLIYLADRVSMEQYCEPITYDCPVSMPHGPVLSRTFELINGIQGDEEAAAWGRWISDRDGYDVSLAEGRQDIQRDDLTHLSDAEFSVLEETWARYGGMNKWQIRDFTHDRCAEWQDPHGSSRPIAERDIFVALGWPEPEAAELEFMIRGERHVSEVLSGL